MQSSYEQNMAPRSPERQGESGRFGWLKLVGGLAVSLFFLYLAFRKVEIVKLAESFREIDYRIVLAATAPVIGACWLRALRHRYLIETLKPVTTASLFSALMIGYTANTVLPARLGEILRAYIIGKREAIPLSSTFASIVIERVIDVLSLLLLIVLIASFYPLPREVSISSYLTFSFFSLMILFFWILKKWPEKLLVTVQFLIGLGSSRIAEKIATLILTFRDGLVPLKTRKDYLFVFVMSGLIWLCYALVYYLGFQAFDFLVRFKLPWSASFVVMGITTISVVIPSSPGYVGTFHWLNMISLALFNIPNSDALSYAIVIHAVNTIPIVLAGFVLAWKEKIAFSIEPRGVMSNIKTENVK